MVVALATPPAADADGPSRSFELAVPVGAHDATATPWRSPPLRPAHRFDLVGADWSGPGADVELRAHRASGGWTRWGEAHDGEPVWSGRADAVQLRARRAPHALRLRFVRVGGASATGAPRATPARVGDRPAIVPRSAWDPHDECRPRAPARYGRIDLAFVHHTESLSLYAPQQSAALVRGICLFHRNANGWNDIGYNLLVDRYGTVFEGRAGGVDQPVIGAQAGGWNTVSTGVAVIGSWTAEAPPAAAMRALERVLAWKLSLAGAPATGTVVERSLGGEENRHRRGARVTFQRIAGHRDADLTVCPGPAFAAQLPRIRTAVAALLPPPREQLTISPVGAPVEQGPQWLTGRLVTAGGRRPAGADVRVEQQGADGAWHEVAAVRTGPDGVWSALPQLTTNGALRAIAPALGLASPVVEAQVRAAVRVRVSQRRARPGATIELTGTTSPPKARVRVLVDRRVEKRRFRRIATHVVTTVTGAFTSVLRVPGAGVYRVRATTTADAANAAGISRALAIRVLTARP